jgi:hypothetical protein
MTDIREGINIIDVELENCLSDVYNAGKWGADPIATVDTMRKSIKANLSAQGVVQKVEGELPKLVSLEGNASVAEKAAYALGVADIKEQMTGYTLTKEIDGV